MSFNVGSTKGSTEGQTELDPEIKNRWMEFWGKADDVYKGMEEGWKTGSDFLPTGQMVAPLSAEEQRAIRETGNRAFAGEEWLGQAKENMQDLARGGAYMPIQAQRVSGITSQSAPDVGGTAPIERIRVSPNLITSQSAPDLGGVQPLQAATVQGAITSQSTPDIGALERVAAQTVPGSNLGAYMNPYEDAVMDRRLKDLFRAKQLEDNANASERTSRGAWGSGGFGSRAGVEDAETNRAYLDAVDRASAESRQAGFDTAAGLQQSDADRLLSAATTNQGLSAQRTFKQADMAFDRGTQNMDAWNRVASQNAENEQAARMAGAQMGQERDLARYGTEADFRRMNASAFNTGAMTDAEMAQQRALREAELERERQAQRADIQAGQTLENQRQYNALAESDAERAFRAAEANQRAYASDAGLQLDATRGLADIAGQAQMMGLTGSDALMQAGAAWRGVDQASRDATMDELIRRQGLRTEGLKALSLPFGFYPSTSSGGTTSTQSRGSQIGAGTK